MKRFVKNMLGLTRINGRVEEVAARVALLEKVGYTPTRNCWRSVQSDFYEPQVNLPLRDLCRPGMTVFDCGANIGMLSLLMSRLVGPRGIVCAFEASPRNVEMCQNDLVANGCGNVTLYHRALCDRSGKWVPFYFRGDLQADGIVAAPNEKPACQVLSLALDDFVAHSNLIPDVLKFDIEGAEFDALKGFSQTLNRHRPHLIVETQTDDHRALFFLRELGYRAIELNTYREIVSPADYLAGTNLRSLLYIHGDRLRETPYALPIASEVQQTLTEKDFKTQPDGRIENANPLLLPSGRYVVEVSANTVVDGWIACGVRVGERLLAEFKASSAWICSSYREWVIDLDRTEQVTLFASHAAHIRIEGAVIRRIVPLSRPDGWRAFV